MVSHGELVFELHNANDSSWQRIGREIVDEGNLAITNDRSIMAHANHIMLALEFSESNNKDVQRLVDQFLRKPPRG